MTADSHFRSSDPALLASRLGCISITLLLLYAVRVIAICFPFRPLETIWQARVISALLESAALPLLALGLVHLAAYLDPGNLLLSRGRDKMARMAILASIGFLLLLPLQGFASWNSVTTAQSRVFEKRAIVNQNFALLREAIMNSNSMADMQRRLRTLESPELTIRFKDLGLPLPETQRQLLTRLNALQEQVKGRINPPAGEAIEDVARYCLRVMATSLVYALAFAMAAQRSGQPVPLLVELLALWNLGSEPRRRATLDDADLDLLGAPPVEEENDNEKIIPPALEPPRQADKPSG